MEIQVAAVAGVDNTQAAVGVGILVAAVAEDSKLVVAIVPAGLDHTSFLQVERTAGQRVVELL